MGHILDLSHHQGSIDFDKLVKQDIDFVVIRVQYGSRKEDTRYKEYIKECKRVGIKFGLYAYARFVSQADAVVEANDFLKRADADAAFLVVDVEEETTRIKSDMYPSTQKYVNVLKSAGWKVGLYTGHHFYKPYGLDKVKADFLWIPRYGKKPDFTCDLWQHTDSGKVSGINGNVDMNTLNSDKPLSFYLGEVVKEVVEVVEVVKEIVKEAVKANVTATYKVKSGDTLTSIAKACNTTVDELVAVNDIKNKNVIKVGVVLTLPKGKTPATSKTAKETKTVYHKVKAGDTVAKLAKEYGSTQKNIKAWNKLDSKFTIYAGKTIRVK